MTAFLDCSKGYERVPHTEAAERALSLGAPRQLVQLMLICVERRGVYVYTAPLAAPRRDTAGCPRVAPMPKTSWRASTTKPRRL